jgi:hypothetical protein
MWGPGGSPELRACLVALGVLGAVLMIAAVVDMTSGQGGAMPRASDAWPGPGDHDPAEDPDDEAEAPDRIPPPPRRPTRLDWACAIVAAILILAAGLALNGLFPFG